MTFALLFLIMIANIIDTSYGKPVIEPATTTSEKRMTYTYNYGPINWHWHMNPIKWHMSGIPKWHMPEIPKWHMPEIPKWHMPEIPTTWHMPEIHKNRTVILNEMNPKVTYSESISGNNTSTSLHVHGIEVNVDKWNFSVQDFFNMMTTGAKMLTDWLIKLHQLRIQSGVSSGNVTHINLQE
ncbi:uncharacterized protein LOC135838550 [Planococcus citri]|uniref:uncharacterized protein LOC135838550 n=1 Tax=Planococcus citri TaxID=170843 RepID=UPI0031F87DC3